LRDAAVRSEKPAAEARASSGKQKRNIHYWKPLPRASED
jgi:hypothetical protein